MLHQIKTGDIVLCENKLLNQTNAYLVIYDHDNGFGLWCLGCGEALGFYGDDVDKMKEDLLDKDFLNIQAVIHKEIFSEYINKNYKLNYPVKPHDGYNGLNLVIDLD